MSTERNAAGLFSMLLSPEYRFATILNKSTDDARILALFITLLGCYAA
jgi:hypothetical protein